MVTNVLPLLRLCPACYGVCSVPVSMTEFFDAVIARRPCVVCQDKNTGISTGKVTPMLANELDKAAARMIGAGLKEGKGK